MPIFVYLKHLCSSYRIIIILSLILSCGLGAQEPEAVFSTDRNLLAISHYNSLAETDAQVQAILANINPNTPTTNPILDLLASEVLVENYKDLITDDWVEALYFSLPLEKDNNWVYIFHIRSPEKYIGSLLGTGNIRQEQTEDDITRYRRTDGLDSEIYYLAYGNNQLAIMSRSYAAVANAIEVYNDEEISRTGLITDSEADYTLTLHLNRYFQANSRVLPRFMDMLHYDIFRDLAGTTAKSDNILSSILNFTQETIKSLISEIAIVTIRLYLNDAEIVADTAIEIQYGGSLHYALSAYTPNSNQLLPLLPRESVLLNQITLWPEEYIQIMEGLGNLGTALNNKSLDRATQDKATSILEHMQQANPTSVQQGVLTPEPGSIHAGPVATSIITFDNTSKLPEFFSLLAEILTIGEYSEFLAEKGIKVEIQNRVLGKTDAGTVINDTEILMRSTYFTLPDEFQRKQHIISTLLNDKFITVVPLAPLLEQQYENTREFCIEALNKVTSSAKNISTENNSELTRVAVANNRENTILNLTFNPLRYLQVALLSEEIWPSPSPPNRLPIPWREFSQYFNAKEAGGTPLNLTVNSSNTSLEILLNLPVNSLTSLLQAILNLSTSGGIDNDY